MSKDLLKEIAEDIAAIQKKAVKKLEGTEYAALGTTVSYGLEKLVNQLSHLGGFATGSGVKQEFKPISNFMGEDLQQRKPVTKEDTAPTPTEKQIFDEKVNAYQHVLPLVDTATVLKDSKAPGQEIVIRAIAKRAKVKDYAKAEFTVSFIEAIKAGLATNAADAEKKRQFEADLLTKKNGGVKAPAIGNPLTENLPAAIIQKAEPFLDEQGNVIPESDERHPNYLPFVDGGEFEEE